MNLETNKITSQDDHITLTRLRARITELEQERRRRETAVDNADAYTDEINASTRYSELTRAYQAEDEARARLRAFEADYADELLGLRDLVADLQLCAPKATALWHESAAAETLLHTAVSLTFAGETYFAEAA